MQSIFDTVGSHSKHKDGQYHFEIEDGKVRWFHRNENRVTIFSLLTRPTIREGKWTQIAATYSANQQRARVSVVARRLPPYVSSILINAPKPKENNSSTMIWVQHGLSLKKVTSLVL